jgi:hypothetical protein
MTSCPKCGSTDLIRSRTKNRWEIWRKEVTSKRPFRCRRCSWRGWALAHGTLAPDPTSARARAPESPALKETPFVRKDKRKAPDLRTLDTFAHDDKDDD